MSSVNFQKIHDEFRPRIFHYLSGMAGKDNAEDLTQVVFEKVSREFEGMKNREIADILAISVDNVKIRLHRARTQLRKDIKTECNLDRDERNELVCYPK